MIHHAAARQPATLKSLPKTLGDLSTSTALLIDGAIGAGVGYLIAPASSKTGYALGGGLASGFFGLMGLAGTLVYRYAIDKRG
jgi:hypothetical protein